MKDKSAKSIATSRRFYCDTGMKAVLRMLRNMMLKRFNRLYSASTNKRKKVKADELCGKLFQFYASEVLQSPADMSLLDSNDKIKIESIFSIFFDRELRTDHKSSRQEGVIKSRESKSMGAVRKSNFNDFSKKIFSQLAGEPCLEPFRSYLLHLEQELLEAFPVMVRDCR